MSRQRKSERRNERSSRNSLKSRSSESSRSVAKKGGKRLAATRVQEKKTSRFAEKISSVSLMSMKNWRFNLMTMIVCLLAIGLFVRIASLQVVPDIEQGYVFLQDQGEARTIRQQEIPAYRGSITDRNGNPLAISTPLVALWVNPSQILDQEVPALAEAMGQDLEELKARLENYRSKSFMYLRRSMAPSQAEAVLGLNLKGVYGETEYRRFYPEAEVTAQLIGLTNIDDKGIEGIELGYDTVLRGESGAEQVVKNLHGQIVDRLGVVKEVEPGQDIQLTVDLRLQYLAYKSLKETVAKHKAASASMVIMDPKTGEILAMVSQPSFNPNARDQINPNSMRNRAVVDSFEPGSTVKPFTLMAAMEEGLVTADTEVDTSPGFMRVTGKLIEDPRNYGVLDVRSILAKSSQIGTVLLALQMEPETVHGMFQRVGLGTPPGLGFPGERGGILPQHSRWNDIQRATFSFGYGMTATSLQLAQAYSVLANGGKLVSPVLVKGTAMPPSYSVVDEELVRQVREMMVDVVDSGTGTRAQIKGFDVAGKTGTGHLVGSGGYEDSRYASLFAGMVPTKNPELVAVVVVTDPQSGDYFGGVVAAPVFSEVMTDALRIMRILPNGSDEELGNLEVVGSIGGTEQIEEKSLDSETKVVAVR